MTIHYLLPYGSLSNETLAYIRAHPGCTVSDLQQQIEGLEDSTMEWRVLLTLEKLGFITTTRHDTEWELRPV